MGRQIVLLLCLLGTSFAQDLTLLASFRAEADNFTFTAVQDPKQGWISSHRLMFGVMNTGVSPASCTVTVKEPFLVDGVQSKTLSIHRQIAWHQDAYTKIDPESLVKFSVSFNPKAKGTFTSALGVVCSAALASRKFPLPATLTGIAK